MKLFITGISTDVGKTIASAILTEALQADYWKPVQTGSSTDSDAQTIKRYISNDKTIIHENAYAFELPASPHAAAKAENQEINLQQIKEPITHNHLIIEGAGGILVPLNNQDYVVDLIQSDYQVVLVSKNYLGSINHTLLTVEVLKARKINIAGIIFNGETNLESERIILQNTGLKCLGRIYPEPYFDSNVIKEYANSFQEELMKLIS